tara:strand:- start:6507 stop:6725 length:219 start_codon:yes stop_codon:yes gene_type:complete
MLIKQYNNGPQKGSERKIMTDFTKYKNVTVDNETYKVITRMQTKLTPDVKLSRSQVVKTLVTEKARKLNGKL